MSTDETHIRHCLLHEFNKGNNAVNAVKNICDVYGDNVIKVRKCQQWFAKFRSGDFDLSDRPRSGRPSDIDINALKALVESDPRQTTRELADKLQCAQSTVTTNLHELGTVNKCGVWYCINYRKTI